MKPADGCVLEETRDVRPVDPFRAGFQCALQAGDAPMTCCGEKKTTTCTCDEPSTINTALLSTSGVYSATNSSNGTSLCGWSPENQTDNAATATTPTPTVDLSPTSWSGQKKVVTPPGQHFIGTDRWGWSAEDFSDLDSVLRLQSYLCNPPKISVSASTSTHSFASTQWDDDYQAEIEN